MADSEEMVEKTYDAFGRLAQELAAGGPISHEGHPNPAVAIQLLTVEELLRHRELLERIAALLEEISANQIRAAALGDYGT